VDDAHNAQLEFVETDAIRWFREEILVEQMSREEELISALGERVEQIRKEAGRAALVRFVLTGRSPLHSSLARTGALRDIAAHLREGETGVDDFVWVESIGDATRPDVDLEQRRKSEDFLGDFLRAVQGTRDDPEKLREMRRALEPVLSDPRGRKHLSEPDDEQLRAWLDAAETHGLDALMGEEGG
jgi:hypothetical protein